MNRGAFLVAALQVTCLLAAPRATSPSEVEPKELLSVFVSSGGPAPYIVELDVEKDGTVLIGSVGKLKECREKLKAERRTELLSRLHADQDTLESAWVAFHGDFDDTREVTFVLPKAPQPGYAREITIPLELFPVSLLSLAELVDTIEAEACSSGEWGIIKKVNR